MSDDGPTLDQESLRHRLAEVPQTARPHIRMGYHLLSRISESSLEKLRNYVLASMETSRDLDVEQAQQLSGLNEHTINDALTALAFTIASAVDLDVSSQDFIEFIGGEALDTVDIPVVQYIFQGLESRKLELRTAFELSSVANAILPSFRNLAFETEIRVRFDRDNEIVKSVPIAVFYITTDCEQEIYFQADFDDVDRMIKKLNDVRGKLDILAKMRVVK